MQKKTEGLYSAVISKILELIPGFSPKLAVSDFEKASRNVFLHFSRNKDGRMQVSLHTGNLEKNANIAYNEKASVHAH